PTPTSTPTTSPTPVPTSTPTPMPSTSPTPVPTPSPTNAPVDPTPNPTPQPSPAPTPGPTGEPTSQPTPEPTPSPTPTPTNAPVDPTPAPTPMPSDAPTPKPTAAPSSSPTSAPTDAPTPKPTAAPSSSPTHGPTAAPTSNPTQAPTTVSPTGAPTSPPTPAPTPSPVPPTEPPTDAPTSPPTPAPTSSPVTPEPTADPTPNPTPVPTTPVAQYKAVCGSTNGGCKDNPVLGEDETELHEVRCCADTNLGTDWSKKTGCTVWGESEISGVCYPSKTLAEATDLCSSVNARLCTEQELLGDCTRGTGCGYDGQHNWSSTPFTPCTGDASCDDGLECTVNTCGTDGICQTNPVTSCGNKIVCGSSTNGGCASPRVRQAGSSELHEVRCCSDTSKAGWVKKTNCDVWGESNVPECNSLKTLAEAEIICLSADARLCRAEELEADCTKGSGCQFDREHVWSSSP
ncbi:hypothetical protein ACHAXR_012703, partial [Thalassiosira sp. AJA248-18]